MNDKIFDKLSELDDETVDKIAERYPDMNDAETERILRKTMSKLGEEPAGDVVSGTEPAKKRNIWRYGTAAAAALIAVIAVLLMISGLKNSPDLSPDEDRDPLPPVAVLSTEPTEGTGEPTIPAVTTADAPDTTIPTSADTSAKNTDSTNQTFHKTTNTTTSESGGKATTAKTTTAKTTTAKTTAAKTTTTSIIDPSENRLREQMIAEGKLPKDQGRMTLAEAKSVIRDSELQHLAGNTKILYIRNQFNKLHGAPDLEFGSGISHVSYYLDDKGSEQIDFSIGSADYTVQYSNNLTGESCELTQKPIGSMTLAELEEAERQNFTEVYTRRRKILSGELPEDQPRFTLKTANDLMDSLSGAPITRKYMLSKLNEIHGAPDVEYGSGTMIWEYYFDEYGVERMTVNVNTGRVEYINHNTGAQYGLYGRVNWASDMSLEHLIEYEQSLSNNAFCMRRRMVLAGDLPEMMPYMTLDKARELIAKCGAPSSYYDYDWMMKVKKEFDDYCGAPDIVYLGDPGSDRIHAVYAFDGSYCDGNVTFVLDSSGQAIISCHPSGVSDNIFSLIPEPVSR